MALAMPAYSLILLRHWRGLDQIGSLLGSEVRAGKLLALDGGLRFFRKL